MKIFQTDIYICTLWLYHSIYLVLHENDKSFCFSDAVFLSRYVQAGVPFFNKRYMKGVPFLLKWYIKG